MALAGAAAYGNYALVKTACALCGWPPACCSGQAYLTGVERHAAAGAEDEESSPEASPVSGQE